MMTKLTGKEGPWNIGALAAWDAPNHGDEKIIKTPVLKELI